VRWRSWLARHFSPAKDLFGEQVGDKFLHLSKIDQQLTREQTHLERSAGAYFRENFSCTFSGFNYLPAFLNLLLQVGVERILFSADYPYAPMESARNFLDQLSVSPADKEQIAHGNAERLLKIRGI